VQPTAYQPPLSPQPVPQGVAQQPVYPPQAPAVQQAIFQQPMNVQQTPPVVTPQPVYQPTAVPPGTLPPTVADAATSAPPVSPQVDSRYERIRIGRPRSDD
jgi:hypothetical protein